MNRPHLEAADVFRAHRDEFLREWGGALSHEQRQAIKAIAACRTRELGGHVEQCDHCEHRKVAYNSCRNRHCPKCQAGARAKWMAERESELLPVPYFHVVFTIPHELAPLALQNKRLMYGILFQAAAKTLREVARNPKHLGAEIGFLGVLHTWGQNLMHHPHVHFVVPGGGLSKNEAEWIPCKRSKNRKKAFFLPVRVLSRVFRGKFIAALKRAKKRNELRLYGAMQAIEDSKEWTRFLDSTVREEWVVYAKQPFGGREQVLKYLARYTHRVAISNQRLVGHQDGQVAFRYKDYADGSREKTMIIQATEFMRRFLMHVLPRGFTRIRHFGFLSGRRRTASLATCRRLLTPPIPEQLVAPEVQSASSTNLANECIRCPHCQTGSMVVIERLPTQRGVPSPHFRGESPIVARLDSS